MGKTTDFAGTCPIRSTSVPRLAVEAFAVIALVWLAWVALWLLEQRW
jgi:hypothetical protein